VIQPENQILGAGLQLGAGIKNGRRPMDKKWLSIFDQAGFVLLHIRPDSFELPSTSINSTTCQNDSNFKRLSPDRFLNRAPIYKYYINSFQGILQHISPLNFL